MSLIHQQVHISNKIHVLIITFPPVFQCLLSHLQGELFLNMLKTVVALWGYIG